MDLPTGKEGIAYETLKEFYLNSVSWISKIIMK